MTNLLPLEIVQAQLDAYNAKDIEALILTYAEDAEQFTLHGQCFAKGHEQIRARLAARFAEPDLHAKLLHRTVICNFVSDFELITRNFPEGRGTVEMLCLYEVIDGRIKRASFVQGRQRVDTAV